MAAAALVALGHGNLAPRWADRYRRRLGLLPAATSPVTAATWREALGAEERLADCAPAALRLLLPHMRPETQRIALAYFWQSEAAAVAAYGEDSDGIDAALEGSTATWTDVVDRSIEDDDPHSIKFVEACLREFRARPSPAYLAAALDWSNRLRAAASWSHEQRVAAGIVMV